MARAIRPTQRGSRPPPRRRRSGSLLFVVLAILAVLWLGYWYGANQIATATLDRATTAATARGYSLTCTEPLTGGFPFSLDLSCTRAGVAGSVEPVTATVEGIDASAPLYWPGRVAWQAKGPLTLDVPEAGLGLTASWSTIDSHVDAGMGGLSGFGASARGLGMRLMPGRNVGGLASGTAADASLSVAASSGDDYRLTASADTLAVEMADGRRLPAIDLDADIAAEGFGNSLGLDPRGAFRAWVARGGAIRIDGLAVDAGDVTTATTGKLAVSQQGLLTGTLKVEIGGVETLPDLVESFRPGSRDDVSQVVAAIVAFTRPVETPEGQKRELPLIVRDSVVSIGLIPIGVIPPLAF